MVHTHDGGRHTAPGPAPHRDTTSSETATVSPAARHRLCVDHCCVVATKAWEQAGLQRSNGGPGPTHSSRGLHSLALASSHLRQRAILAMCSGVGEATASGESSSRILASSCSSRRRSPTLCTQNPEPRAQQVAQHAAAVCQHDATCDDQGLASTGLRAVAIARTPASDAACCARSPRRSYSPEPRAQPPASSQAARRPFFPAAEQSTAEQISTGVGGGWVASVPRAVQCAVLCCLRIYR
jgi:hypothetical protein